MNNVYFFPYDNTIPLHATTNLSSMSFPITTNNQLEKVDDSPLPWLVVHDNMVLDSPPIVMMWFYCVENIGPPSSATTFTVAPNSGNKLGRNNNHQMQYNASHVRFSLCM